MPGPSRTPGSRRDSKTEWTQLPGSGRTGEPPKLPNRRPAWLKATREWWTWLWSTPQATQFSESDQTLIRMAELVDTIKAGGAPASLFGELRQLEDRYGLTPKAMVQLRWMIVDEPDEPAVQPAGTVDLTEERRKRREAAAG